MPLYNVRGDVSHVAGKPVPETRQVELTEAQALYDLSLERIELAAPPLAPVPEKPAKKPVKPAEVSGDGGH